jgi:hypothetical protein
MERDTVIFDLIKKECQRQKEGIELIASENFVSDEVMEAMGSCLINMQKVIPEPVITVVARSSTRPNNWRSTGHVNYSVPNMRTCSLIPEHKPMLPYSLPV